MIAGRECRGGVSVDVNKFYHNPCSEEHIAEGCLPENVNRRNDNHCVFWLLFILHKMSQLLKLWYLSHRQPAKAQASLRIHAVSKNQTSSPTGWLRMCI